MSVSDQQAQLIALIDEFSDQECRKLIENAQHKYQDSVKAEYQNARYQVHQAVERERARAISLIRSAEAELHTRQRAQNQRIAQSLLNTGWGRLQKALKQKWAQPEGRRLWIENCAREALIRLSTADNWVVQHPADTGLDELSMFKKLISEKLPDSRIEMHESDIQAGLIIRTNNSLLDMSLSGLLRDRRNIEGRMLALLHRAGEE